MADTQADLLRQLSMDRNTPMSRGGPSRWPWIVAALALLGVAAFFIADRRPAEGATQALVTTVVARSAAGVQAASAVLDASGYVVARRAATVSAKITGKVVDVLIEEGQKVNEGQVLAHLDDANSRAQLDLALAQAEQSKAQATELEVGLTNARRDLQRQSDLMSKKLVSQAAVDNASTAVDQLKARLVSVQKAVAVSQQQVLVARQNVDDSVIRAPFTGVVTVKNAQPGEMISPLSGGGSSFTRSGIGTLVDMNSQEIEVDVAESFIGKVVSGAPVKIKLNAYPDADFKGSVIAIVPTADRAKATVKVRVAFARDEQGQLDARILPEMGARVSFLASQQEAAATAAPKTGVYVPVAAVQGEGAKAHVFVVSDGVAHAQTVVTGAREGNDWLIPQGLAAGTVLAVGNDIKDGQKIAAAPTS